MPNIDLHQLELQVVDIAREVGNIIREKRESYQPVSIEEKSAHNLVTEVDKLAEELLTEKLSKAFPGSGFLGEEGADIPSENGYRWIVDPIDGTTNFVHGLPLYSTSIALEKEGELVLGVVNHISMDRVFHTSLGRKSYCNGIEINTSSQKVVDTSLMVTGFPYHEKQLDQFLDAYKYLLRNSRGVRRLGSAAIDLCLVAAGHFEAFYEVGLNPWDVAAGALLVQNAGGKTSTLAETDDYLHGKSIIASNNHIHRELLDILHQFIEV